MIGAAYKKFASENGLNVSQGVAYGSFRGYATTLSEGAGYKELVITARLTGNQKDALSSELDKHKLNREFRILEYHFFDDGIYFRFNDNPGTMAKIRAFADWFYPCLDEVGAAGTDICTECGLEIIGAGTWKLINGVAFHLHENCARSLVGTIEQEEQIARQEDTGSYGAGLVGALAGAFIGAIVWALVLNFGYVASVVGLLIGWLAERGYRLLHGKNGKGKIVILIVAILFGVILGTFGGDVIAIAELIASGELPILARDIPLLIFYTLIDDADYLVQVLSNIGLGVLFAFLGTFALLKKAKKESSGTKVKDLN